MSEHLSPLFVVAFVAILSLAIVAVSNWLEYATQKRRYHSLKKEAEKPMATKFSWILWNHEHFSKAS
jgi:hypothetical protein